MYKFKRILAGILSATMIMSSMSMGVLADELNTENETVYESVVDEQESITEAIEAGNESLSVTTVESETEFWETSTEEESETIIEVISEIATETETLELDGNGNEIFSSVEYHVADDYAFEYSDEDIQAFAESELSLESIDDITLEESLSSTEQAVAYIKNKMVNRTTSFTFDVPYEIDFEGCIKKAYSVENSVSPKEGDYIRANFIGYGVRIFYGSNIPYTYEVTFIYTSSLANEREVDAKISKIIDELGLKSSLKSDYEKIESIHDYLIENIEYNNDNTNACHGTYSALIKGYCVCQGYAATFYRLCREAGINSRYIVGDQINHAWNIVQLNSEWYNMDVTWDDPLPNGYHIFNYFLKSDRDFTGHPRNSEFRTSVFENAHPMAAESWGNPIGTNFSHIFTTIEGESISSEVGYPDKRAKLMIFYDNSYADAASTIRSIAKCEPVTTQKVEVYAIEKSGSSVSEIRDFAKKNDEFGAIKFCSDNSDVEQRYINMVPTIDTERNIVIVMIDENNNVRFVNTGKMSGDQLIFTYMKYLMRGWNPFDRMLRGISLNKKSLVLGKSNEISDTAQLEVAYLPTDCINEKVAAFSSSDTNVVTVDENGLVTAVGVGKATITASCFRYVETCDVTVYARIDGIQLNDNQDNDLGEKTLEVYAGDSIEVSLVTIPRTTRVRGAINWSVSDGNLANFIKREEGYAIIVNTVPDIEEAKVVTISAEADGLSARCTLRIIPSQVKLNANGGTINGRTYEYMNVIPGMPFGEMPLPDNREGYVFAGWKTSTSAGEGTYITEKTIAGDCWEIFAIWKQVAVEQMWARELGDYQYTGAVIKPQVKVYDGNILLVEGVDYSIVYKNNKNVYQYKEGDEDFLNTKAPCAIVKGKKNYTGSLTVYFTISPKRITDSDVTVLTETLVKTETVKAQYPVPTIKWGKLGLRNKTDFTLTYPDNVDENSYKKPGLYRITINGNGNYTGERTVNMRITDKNAISIKRAVVKNLKNYEFTGSEIKQVTTGDKPFGLYFGGKPLTENVDYYLEYVEGTNINIGTAKINVIGIGDYTGIKPLTFKITGKSIATAVINSEALQPVSYTGQYIEPEVVLTDKKAGKDLVEGTDYLVTYDKNKDVGSAIIKITGINGYTGTLTKRFRINAYKMPDENDENIKVIYDGEVVYRKSGAKPAVAVSYKSIKSDGSAEWQPLTEGTDYTLRYTNNAKVYEYGPSDEGFYEKNGKTKSPVVTITLKKNFAGKIAKYYKITPGSLNNQATISAPDVTYSDKPLKWKSKLVVTDMDGKKLAVKTDYSVDVIYTYADDATMADGTTRTAGTTVGEDDIPMAGTVINVTVTGTGNYSSSDADKLTVTQLYKILAADRDIGKGITFAVADKYYNGSGMNPDTGIVISKSDITFKPDAKHSEFTDDNYEIVPGSYTKNRFIGVASVTLRGINGYGGTKVVKFRIKSKSII